MCAPLQPPGAPARGVNGWAHREGEWQSAPHRLGSDEVAIAGRAMAYRASATVAFATAVASARVGAAAATASARANVRTGVVRVNPLLASLPELLKNTANA